MGLTGSWDPFRPGTARAFSMKVRSVHRCCRGSGGTPFEEWKGKPYPSRRPAALQISLKLETADLSTCRGWAGRIKGCRRLGVSSWEWWGLWPTGGHTFQIHLLVSCRSARPVWPKDEVNDSVCPAETGWTVPLILV